MLSFFNSRKGNIKTDNVENRLDFSKRLQVVTNKIHATSNLDEIMLDLSKDICELFDCDRLTLYAVNKERNVIYSKVKTGINSNKDLVLPISERSIAGYVAFFKRSIRIEDVYEEAELQAYEPPLSFCRDVDQLTNYRTKQMLAAPIVDAKSKELLGVIQLLNNRADNAFSAIAEDGLEELCETMAVAFTQRMKAPSPPSSPPPVHSKYESLVTDSIISAPELDLASRWARRQNLDIEDVLVDEYQVKLPAIGQALAKNFKVPYECYKADRFRPAKLINKLKREFVEEHQWLPISEDDIGLTVLTTDPEHITDMRAIKALFPYPSLFYRITTKREFAQTVEQFFGEGGGRA